MNSDLLEANTEEDRNYKANKISSEILHVLNEFILTNQDLIRRSSNSFHGFLDPLSLNKYESITYFSATFFLLLTFVIAKSDFVGSEIYLLACFFIPLFLLLGLIIHTSYEVFKDIKKTRQKAIFFVESHEIRPYYQIVEYLSETFYEENLRREELRFKLAINRIKNRGNILKKIVPLLAILLVAISLHILGFSSQSDEVKLLYGTIAGISGVVVVVKVILDLYLEWLEQQDIDICEKCILILQAAQDVAREEELDDLSAYDQAISSDEEVILFEEAIAQIEQNRS